MRVQLVDGVVYAVKEELIFLSVSLVKKTLMSASFVSKKILIHGLFSLQPSHRPASWHESPVATDK